MKDNFFSGPYLFYYFNNLDCSRNYLKASKGVARTLRAASSAIVAINKFVLMILLLVFICIV